MVYAIVKFYLHAVNIRICESKREREKKTVRTNITFHTFLVLSFCRPVSCLPNVANVYGFSIFDFPFDFLKRLFLHDNEKQKQKSIKQGFTLRNKLT